MCVCVVCVGGEGGSLVSIGSINHFTSLQWGSLQGRHPNVNFLKWLSWEDSLSFASKFLRLGYAIQI